MKSPIMSLINFKKSNPYKKGISMIEIMLAFAVFALIVPSVAALIMGGYYAYGFAVERHTHFIEARTGLDTYLSAHHFQNILIATTSSIPISSSSRQVIRVIPRGSLFSEVRVQVYNPNLSPQLRGKTSVTLSEIVNGSGYTESDSNCEFYLHSLQKAPEIVEKGSFGFNPENIMTGISVRYPYAFITTNAIATSSPDLSIIDVSSSTHPTFLNSIDTGRGLTGLTIAYPYLFALTDVTSQHIQIFNISIPGSPVLLKSFRLPNMASSSAPKAVAISYFDNKLYIGTEKWNGSEFLIVNVTNIYQPTVIGNAEIGSGVRNILTIGTTSYIANAGIQELKIMDVSNSVRPVSLGSFSPSGWEVQEGDQIKVDGDRLYFGRVGGGFNSLLHHEFFAFNRSDFTLSSSSMIGSLDIPKGVYGIIPADPFVILATASSGSEILTKNILTSSSTSLRLSSNPKKLVCDERTLYSILEEENRLQIFNLK